MKTLQRTVDRLQEEKAELVRELQGRKEVWTLPASIAPMHTTFMNCCITFYIVLIHLQRGKDEPRLLLRPGTHTGFF